MTETRWHLLSGDTWTLEDIASGASVRIDSATTTEELTADTDGISYDPPAVGVYYVATRMESTDPWRRLGVLEVSALVDAIEERLRSELAALNTRVTEAELYHSQVTDPSGTSVTRMNLAQVRRQRAQAEVRLATYIKRKAGRLPVSMT